MRRAGSILCLAIVCALGAGVAAARADEPAAATAAEGVSIGPVAVGGMTLEQATAAVLRAYLRPVVLRVGEQKVSVSPSRFRTVAPVAAAVERALAAPAGTVVSLRASVDQGRLQRYVDALAKRFAREPVASRLLLRNARPVLTTAHPGRAIRTFPTTMLLRNALQTGTRKTIAVPTRTIEAGNGLAQNAGPLIVIRRGSNRLTLYDGTKLVRTFPVATGQAAYPTPLGEFQIIVMWKNPTWYPPTQDAWAKGLKPVPPGPGNPLGTRWMGISSPGVGIHGTDDPASIGYSVSHGCIRMQVPDAEWLFEHVTVGTPVYIVRS